MIKNNENFIFCELKKSNFYHIFLIKKYDFKFKRPKFVYKNKTKIYNNI